MDIYIKSVVSIRIAHVLQHANFQLYRAYLAGVFWKNWQIIINTNISWWRLKRLCAELPPKCQHPARFFEQKFSNSKNFSNCQMTPRWSRDQRVIWLLGYETYCKSALCLVWCPQVVCMYLFCHVISYDHFIEGSCDFMGGNPSW